MFSKRNTCSMWASFKAKEKQGEKKKERIGWKGKRGRKGKRSKRKKS